MICIPFIVLYFYWHDTEIHQQGQQLLLRISQKTLRRTALVCEKILILSFFRRSQQYQLSNLWLKTRMESYSTIACQGFCRAQSVWFAQYKSQYPQGWIRDTSDRSFARSIFKLLVSSLPNNFFQLKWSWGLHRIFGEFCPQNCLKLSLLGQLSSAFESQLLYLFQFQCSFPSGLRKNGWFTLICLRASTSCSLHFWKPALIRLKPLCTASDTIFIHCF